MSKFGYIIPRVVMRRIRMKHNCAGTHLGDIPAAPRRLFAIASLTGQISRRELRILRV